MRRNLGLIFAGLVFFANPNFNLFDILPDFIGAILIMTGLSKMYMYDGNFEDARKGAKFLLWISLLRLVLCFFATSGGRRDYLVPFTFIICVLEAIYMISLFKGLYLGLEYTLMRSDGEGLTKKTNEAFTMSFIFVIGSRILEFAPQICEIYAQDAELDLSAGASFKMSMAQMKMYVFGVCLVCGLILGIIYLFVTADTWIRVIANKNYSPFLGGKYEEYLLNNREEYMASKISTVYFLVTLSFVFFFDFYIDGINIIPSPIGVVLIMAAGLYLEKLVAKGTHLTLVLSFASLISSATSYVFMNKVHLGINYLLSLESYNYENFALLESRSAVFVSLVISAAEFILCSALVLFVLSRARELFSKEKRTVAIPMLKFVSVPSVMTLLSAAVLRVLRTLEGHLATNKVVSAYVQNKAHITSQSEYLEYMQNPLISRYESVNSACYVLSVVTAILAIVCVLYMIRVRRFTEGDYKKK